MGLSRRSTWWRWVRGKRGGRSIHVVQSQFIPSQTVRPAIKKINLYFGAKIRLELEEIFDDSSSSPQTRFQVLPNLDSFKLLPTNQSPPLTKAPNLFTLIQVRKVR